MEIIWFALIGWTMGWLARRVVPGVRSGGVWVDCLTGMVGSLIGWLIALIFPALWILGGFLPAFVGAVVLLLILKATGGSRIRY